MGLNLVKGGSAPLADLTSGRRQLLVELGVLPSHLRPGPQLHGSALVLDRNGTVLSERHVVDRRNMATPDGSVRLLDLAVDSCAPARVVRFRMGIPVLPPGAAEVVFVASTGEDQEIRHFLGDTGGAYVRIIATGTGEEVARYDVTEGLSTETALVLAQMYQHKGQWRFRAVGRTYTTGLAGVAHSYGFHCGDTAVQCCGPAGGHHPGTSDISQSPTTSPRRSP